MKYLKYIIWGFVLLLFALFLGIAAQSLSPYVYKFHPLAKQVSENILNDSSSVVQHINACKEVGNTITDGVEKDNNHDSDGKLTMEDLALWGDSQGAWNMMFSALAFIVAIMALLYQMNRDEKEWKRTRRAQFLDEYYRMLGVLYELIANLEIKTRDQYTSKIYLSNTNSYWDNAENSGADEKAISSDTIKGRACFQYVFESRENDSSVKSFIGQSEEYRSTLKTSEKIDYNALQLLIEVDLGHYFRYLYRILRHIDTSKLLEDIEDAKDVRWECVSILRAQLSTYELLLLFYNGLNPKFRDTSKKLIEKYAMFDNLDTNKLVRKSEREYYGRISSGWNKQQEPDGYIAEEHYSYRAFCKPVKNLKLSVLRKFLRWVKTLRASSCLDDGIVEDAKEEKPLNKGIVTNAKNRNVEARQNKKAIQKRKVQHPKGKRKR